MVTEHSWNWTLCLVVISAGAGSVDGSAPAAAASATGASGAPGASGDMAEDMLQMALRMASEMTEEPVMDLEDSVNPAPVRRGWYCIVIYSKLVSSVSVFLFILKFLLGHMSKGEPLLLATMFYIFYEPLLFPNFSVLSQVGTEMPPGHPSIGRKNQYWWWLQSQLEQKHRVLCKSRLCYLNCWFTDPVC